MDTAQQFLFYPIIVLLAIFLIILSFKLLVRFVLFCLLLFVLWYLLAYLGFVSYPRECFSEPTEWVLNKVETIGVLMGPFYGW